MSPLITRIAALSLLISWALAACSAPVTSRSAATSASLGLPTSTVAGSPAGSAAGADSATPQPNFAAMPGLTFDATLAWAQSFNFTCQSGLVPPSRDDQLLVALCARQSPADNATLDLTIHYWPNNTVLAASAAAQPITSGSKIAGDFRIAWLQWVSGLPYGGADAGAVLDWLLSDQDCSGGCTLDVGRVSWTRSTTAGVEAVSAFVPE